MKFKKEILNSNQFENNEKLLQTAINDGLDFMMTYYTLNFASIKQESFPTYVRRMGYNGLVMPSFKDYELIVSTNNGLTVPTIEYLIEEGFEIEFVNIDENGLVDLEHLKSLIRDDTILVSVAYVDSEIGLVQPINEIGNILKDYPKCFFHVDATQLVGKVKMNFNGHK